MPPPKKITKTRDQIEKEKELEAKIIGKYNKVNPQPQNLKERVELELNKFNK